jgi:hypothetical protein
VVIYTRAPLKSLLILKQEPLAGKGGKFVDSATIKDNHDSLVFYIQNKEQHIYSISLTQNHLLSVFFINDCPIIRIKADFFADTCNIAGSAASNSLKKIADIQYAVSKKANQKLHVIDSLKQVKAFQQDIAKELHQYNDLTAQYFNNYKDYADTVKNPICFINAFTSIQFGKDYSGLRQFINRNSQRFHDNRDIQSIFRQAFVLLRIFENELHPGDVMPKINLPDGKGGSWSNTSLAGNYYLLDLWATWCQQCATFKAAENDLDQTSVAKGLSIVSIALDNNVKLWEQNISKFKYKGLELIDTSAYPGNTMRTLLFDSVPFNFLVNPEGKILAKGVTPDSLKIVVNRYLRKH